MKRLISIVVSVFFAVSIAGLSLAKDPMETPKGETKTKEAGPAKDSKKSEKKASKKAEKKEKKEEKGEQKLIIPPTKIGD